MQLCLKVEKRNFSTEEKKFVARITLSEQNLKKWGSEQREDPDISLIFQGKKAGVRPSHSQVAADVSTRVYAAYWDAILLKNGVLYKQ